tara:strand:+ start:786 stop:2270 length:1485 start_codon:yes stop_codon:yes gene_type:complete
MTIRLRIGILVSTLTAIIVLVSGGVIHRFTETDLENSLDEQLSSQITKVSKPGILLGILARQRFFEYVASPNRLDTSLAQLIDVQIPTLIQVNKDLIISTEGYPDFNQQSYQEGFINFNFNDENWRILTKTYQILDPLVKREIEIALQTGMTTVNQLKEEKIPTNQFIIQTAVKRDSLSTSLQDFREHFIIGGIFSIITSGILGWFFAGIAVSPLKRLGNETSLLRKSEDLSIRISEKYGTPEISTLANQINEMLSRLEINSSETNKALNSSRAFASNLAHEIRTPLTSMKTNLDILKKHNVLPEKARIDIISDIALQQERLLKTLESLRLLSRGDLSEHNVFEEIDFVDFIKTFIGQNTPEDPDINLQLSLPSVDPIVYGWREGIAVLLRNLISNASTHGKLPGSLLNITIYVEAEEKTIDLIVQDNGAGIDESKITNVLDRFTKGHSSKGSGLGLALVKQQAEIHGGEVTISNISSGGTKVQVTLPIIISKD